MNDFVVEHCNPFHDDKSNFWMRLEHLGRYVFAASFAQKKGLTTALDIACADGYGCIELSISLATVVGVDADEKLLALARETASKKNIENTIFKKCDLGNQSLSELLNNDVFDLITSFETLEHLENPQGALQEFYQLLQPNGYLLLSVPNAKFEELTPEGKPLNPFHKQLFSKKDILCLLRDNGFKIHQVLGQPYPNIISINEQKLIKNKKFPAHSISSFYNADEAFIRYFTDLLAIPSAKFRSASYSIIVVAQAEESRS